MLRALLLRVQVNMSMYGDYIKEHRGDGIVENSNGFATYRFLEWQDKMCVYIVDIFVVPSQRKSNVASNLADEITEIGKKNHCSLLLGTVVPSANNSTESLKVLLGYGMKLKEASIDLITFIKEI